MANKNSLYFDVRKSGPNGDSNFTLLESNEPSVWVEKRGGDLYHADAETFIPAFGKYIRDLARQNPEATMTFKVS